MLKLRPKTFFVGQKVVFLPICHSTNDVAQNLALNDFFDGTVVLTDYQTAGRGQRGAVWEGELGQNLMMSVLLDTSFLLLDRQFDLSICCALAVLESIKTLKVNHLKIKWPNDILIGEKKAGGILIENSIAKNRMKYSVIGMGINVNQKSFSNTAATSLINEGYETTPSLLAEKICEKIEFFLLKLKNGADLRAEYLENLFGLGQIRRFVFDGREFGGIIRGVTENGHLIIESGLIKKTFDIKEVKFCFE